MPEGLALMHLRDMALDHRPLESIERIENRHRGMGEAGRVEQLFGTYDVLMTPVVSHSTPAIGHFSPLLSYEHITRRALEYASYAGLQNVSGAPAISLPLGINSNNMPLGVHFTAPYGLDKRLLELAYELEQARPFRLISSLQTA